MNCIRYERHRILCLKTFINNRSESFCVSSMNYLYKNNSDYNHYFKSNRNHYLKSNEQTFDETKTFQRRDNRNQRHEHQYNRSRREENTSFDSRFSDTFGTLSTHDKSWKRFKRLSAEDLPDDDDGYDKLEIKRGPKMAEIGYSKLFTELVHKKPIQIKKALELYNRMISEDRIPPQKCTYTVLISGCAKVGYTEKAFELFEDLLKNKLKPTKQAITALFNACAECPYREYGLQKANYLREWLHLEGIVANSFHFHAMIKAYGKLGDMKTAFQIVDEMVCLGVSTTTETFAMLLMGCISNKESGLYQAIKIIREMKLNNMSLDIYTFNLLLRAIRDCGIGSQNNIKLLMQDWSHRPNHVSRKTYPKNKSSQNSLSVNQEEKPHNFQKSAQINQNNFVDEKSINNSNENSSLIIKTPNLLNTNQSNETQVIDINFDSLSLPSNRFLLFGGIDGYFKMMDEYNVRPNINTLTLMLELIDSDEDSETQLLNALEKYKIRADTDFFNILLKQTCIKRGVKDAKHILSIMQKKGLQFDIITFGVLSLGCNSLALGKQLLVDMEESGLKANTEIIGGLVSSACRINDFWYLIFLINYIKKNQINVDQRIIEGMESIKLKFQKMLADYDRNESKDLPKRYISESFRKGFAIFKVNFEEWLQNVVIVTEHHPWDQFKFEEIKNKKEMHNFVKYMKQKIAENRGENEVIDEYEYEKEDELYNE